jgi:uncharacterized membrane protein
MIEVLKRQSIPIALIALNFVVKGLFLGMNSLAADEPFSVYHAQMSVSAIIRLLSSGNNPPLYEILLHFWIKVFGISEFSVRFPSLLFSGVTVFFIYQIGRKFLSNNIAILASIIFIFSNYQIELTHESRVYSLLGMFTALSMFYYITILHHSHSKNEIPLSTFVKLAITNALIGYSHYFGLLVVLIQLLFIFFHFHTFRYHIKRIFLSHAITAILYLPNLPTLMHRFGASSGGTWIPPLNGLNSLYNMMMTFANAPMVVVCILVVWTAALIRYITQKPRKHNLVHRFVVFWFGTIFFGMYLISFRTPIFFERYLMPAAIAFPLLVAMTCSEILSNRKSNRWIQIIMGLLFIATVNLASPTQINIRECVGKLKSLKTQNTVVYICPDWLELNFVYYYDERYFRDFNDTDIKQNIYRNLKAENIYPIKNGNQIPSSSFIKGNKILFLDDAAEFNYPNNQVKEVLDRHCKLLNCYKFKNHFSLYEYEVLSTIGLAANPQHLASPAELSVLANRSQQ